MQNQKDFRDISWKVDEPTYRADSALSYSTLARFAREGFTSLSHLNDTLSTPSLTFGSAVDSIITGGRKEFEEKFFIADFPDIPDSIIQIVKELFNRFGKEVFSLSDISTNIIIDIATENNYQNNWKPETRAKVIIEKGSAYYDILQLAGDKTIINLKTNQLIENSVSALKDSEATKWYFAPDNVWGNIKRYYQLKFKTVHNDITYRCMADLIIVDYENKVIYPIDLKTSSHNEWDFYQSFVQWRYDIQARLYWRIIKDNMLHDEYFKDFKLADYQFIVVNKFNCIPLVWEFNETKAVGKLEFNDISLEDPYSIGEELSLYLKQNAIVPHGINLNNTNNIVEWLNKKK